MHGSWCLIISHRALCHDALGYLEFTGAGIRDMNLAKVRVWYNQMFNIKLSLQGWPGTMHCCAAPHQAVVTAALALCNSRLAMRAISVRPLGIN